jgi:four helix bundle protein
MALERQRLPALRAAEILADNVWKRAVHWGPFARDTVGQRLSEAADSIGANIAEASARPLASETLACLSEARGSLFVTKYWLNRAQARELIDAETAASYASELADLARLLNALVASTREQCAQANQPSRAVRDGGADYAADEDLPEVLFSLDDLAWLGSP